MVALKGWEPLRSSVRTALDDPEGKVVFGRRHIVTHPGEDVCTVRKGEDRAIPTTGGDTLLGSDYPALYVAKSLPQRHGALLTALWDSELKGARAWQTKENVHWPWTDRSPAESGRSRRRYFWGAHAQLAPIIAEAQM